MSSRRQEIFYIDLSGDTGAKDEAAGAVTELGFDFRRYTNPVVAFKHASTDVLAGIIEARPSANQQQISRIAKIKGALGRFANPDNAAAREIDTQIQRQTDMRYMRDLAENTNKPYFVFQPVPEDVLLLPDEVGIGSHFNFHAGSESLHDDMKLWLGARLLLPEEPGLALVPDQA